MPENLFIEAQFPVEVGRGAAGGPRRRTDVVTLANGFEERNSLWRHSRREYQAGLGVQNVDNLYEVLEFFEATLGRLRGFRWKDWADYRSGAPNSPVKATDQPLKVLESNAQVFQLVKVYYPGVYEYSREITKPVEGTVTLSHNGALLTEGVDFLVDYATGLIYLGFHPLHLVTAGFEFDVPARFQNDSLNTDVEVFAAGSIPQIDVIEVRTPVHTTADSETADEAYANWVTMVDIDNSVNTNWNTIWGVS